MRQILLQILATAVLGGGIPVFAQSPPSTPASPPASQASAPGFSDSIVVSASLEPEERDRVPASVGSARVAGIEP